MVTTPQQGARGGVGNVRGDTAQGGWVV